MVIEWGGSDGAMLMLPGSTEEAPEPAWDGEDYFFVDPSSLVAGNLDRPEVRRSVELDSPQSLPAECTPEDLQRYTDLPNPIPASLEEGF